jgi:hypothetical protein
MIYVFSLPSGQSLFIPADSLQSATARIKQNHEHYAFIGIAFQPR